jgi:putative FmdB family regulatory protein
MPIYEYECPKCGRFDVLQKMSSKALVVHDVCGSKVKKLMSAAGFSFKGSGFYVNDYGGRNAAAITDRPEKKKAEAKPSACAGCPSNKPA